jgi:hypothetical protein
MSDQKIKLAPIVRNIIKEFDFKSGTLRQEDSATLYSIWN